MKYTLTVEISATLERVAELYPDPTNWPKWQNSLVSYEPITGSERAAGSKIKLINRFGKKHVEIVETVELNQLPDRFICIYEARGTWNRVENRFLSIDESTTRWEFETEFRCGGILKLMSMLMPGMFRKASLKEMEAFKEFAESNRQ